MTFVNRPIALALQSTAQDANHHDFHLPPYLNDAHPHASHETEISDGFTDLDVFVSEEDRAFWGMMKPQGRPSFSLSLLSDLARMKALIRRLCIGQAPRARPFDYFVLASNTPGAFNLGGDLALFVEKIRNGDSTAMRHYAYACTDAVFANYTGYVPGLITIGLVEGDALGGGWEAALSCDVLVAERRARFGLPEILFNLFPGMGAYSFLSRRLGQVKAEELILSGRTYSAEEMHKLGIVDVLAENGDGRRATRAFMAANRGKLNARAALYQVRRRVSPVTMSELRDVVDLWVDAAMALSEQDLRKMVRLAAAQDRFRDRAAPVSVSPAQMYAA
jgi:DSF synthase